MPILLRGLDLNDSDLRTNILETLLQVATEATGSPTALVEHAGSLVRASLSNSQPSDGTTPVRRTLHPHLHMSKPESFFFSLLFTQRVQICALRLLAALPATLRYDVLHPYKAQVLRQLGFVLDDRERAVRKEAVDCR